MLIDRPDRRERAAIFAVHTQNLTLGDDIDLELLAGQTPGFAGAEIANVCNEAALLAARDGKDAVEMIDFERAIDRVIGGLEKKNKLISPEEKKIVAYHEAGHAVEADDTAAGSRVDLGELTRFVDGQQRSRRRKRSRNVPRDEPLVEQGRDHRHSRIT